VTSAERNARIDRVENGLIPQSIPPGQEDVRHVLRDRMAFYGVPGVSFAVINHGEIAWARGHGVHEAGGSLPVTPDTLLQAASISKSVSALAALRLVEAGDLDLDVDVNRYLKAWKVPVNRDGWQPTVSLRGLLSHTAGTTVHGFPGYQSDDELPSLPEILDGRSPSNTPPIWVDSVPGLQYRYSGGGYCILQQVLEDRLKKPFPEIMRRLVLQPIGMTRSSFQQPLPRARWDEAASGHRTGRDVVGGHWRIYPELAAAGLWTTASDLALFAIEIQRAVAGRSVLLSKQVASQMLTPQVAENAGLGFWLEPGEEWQRFQHSGGNEGYVCLLIAYSMRATGAIVMTNSDAGWPLIAEIMASIAREYQWPDYLPEKPAPVAVDPTVYHAYTGGYELPTGHSLTIEVEQESLMAHFPGQVAIRLLARSQTRFYASVANFEIEFLVDEYGMVTGMAIRQNGREIVATRAAGTP
jgi:CubicO group peptidase (beta-lactamase class C family)